MAAGVPWTCEKCGRCKVAKARAETRLSRLIVAGAYPAIMASGFGLFAVLGETELSLTLAAYISVLCCAGLITLHEFKLPYRREWKPAGGEVTADALFMVTVQIALPYLLGISLVLALADFIATKGFALQTLSKASEMISVVS